MAQTVGHIPSLAEFGDRVAKILADLADETIQRREMRRSYKQLSALSDRQLMDIGLTRFEVEEAKRKGAAIKR